MPPSRPPLLLGQFFTPPHIVDTMWSLKHNHGQILEPASGNNAFLHSHLAQNLPITALEIDPSLNPPLNTPPQTSSKTPHNIHHYHHHIDFFDYPLSETFDTIIGNPPYVRFQEILPSTHKKISAFLQSLPNPSHTRNSAKILSPTSAFDNRTNLYLFFIYKAVLHLKDNGELIFITPRDFTKATSAQNLNEFLYDNGTITHFQDYGDTKIFRNATPNCAVWRFEKGNTSTRMADGRTFLCHKGQLTFAPPKSRPPARTTHRLGDSFEVKVGAVSGADHIYESQRYGEQDFVCSRTRTTGNLKRMIYNKPSRALLLHKQELLARRIRKFDETNWWQWGRTYPERTGKRIYVNGKTRVANPFFVSEEKAFDGSVLALFPKKRTHNLTEICDRLNRLDWRALGFMTGGRYLFSQRSLENANIDLAL